jgi:SAM-dependent methyltransferase
MTGDVSRVAPPDPAVARAAEHWGQMAQVSADERRDVSWLDSKLVQRLYLHPQIGGDPDRNWLDHFKRRHLPRTVSRGLTIGCGDGGLERHGTALGLCEHFDAFDVSPGAIEVARAAAAKAGLTTVTYAVQDLNHAAFEPDRYDVAFASMALHHIERLEHLFEQVRAALKPGGLFVFNEYVGPDRFQWARRQLIAINLILVLLPTRLRRSLTDGQIKKPVRRPTVEAMIQIDPSEAVRSSAILPLVEGYFHTIERIDYGGTILHMLLQDIIGNFRAGHRGDLAVLRTIFALERWLLLSKFLSSDFTMVVARRD